MDQAEGIVHQITDRRTFSFTFRADLEQFDELVPGYLHVRISNVMLVSDCADPGDDVFQRTDEYYVYLRPQTLSENDVRQRNGWAPGALVPRWIGMPAH